MHVCRHFGRFPIRSPRGLRRGVALVVAAWLFGSGWAAHAATATYVALDYVPDRTLGCMDEDDLRRAVTSQLGYDPFRPDADIQIAVHVVKGAADWEGHIEWKRAGGRLVGERLVQSRGRDCRDVMAKVAFAVVVQIQLIDLGSPAAAATEAPATNVAEAARPAPSVVDAESSSDVSTARTARPLRLALGMGPLVGLGVAPKVIAAGRLFAVLRAGRWSAELAADAALPVTRQERDGSGIVVNAAGTSLAGCAQMSVVVSCLVGRLGWLHARGVGIDVPSAGSAYFGQMGLRLGAAIDVGRLMLGVHADGLVMLSDWDVVQNDVVVWTVPRIGAFIGIDAAFIIF